MGTRRSGMALEGDMLSPTNTADAAKRDPMMQTWVMGGNPNAILAQEAEGQKEVETGDVLPKEMTDKEKAALEAEGSSSWVRCRETTCSST